ncbi:MAG: sugar-binding transcriptional regulator [Thermoprotei archaeon]|nr:MAG: sugar-binding transcriptional regulator [Thermoprotei archaeon]
MRGTFDPGCPGCPLLKISRRLEGIWGLPNKLGMDDMAERKEVLAQVASMYYEADLMQGEIAKRLDISPSTVSRLLQEARDVGVVEITIHYPWKSSTELEEQIANRFDLRHVKVLSSRGQPYTKMLQGLGVLAARYLESILSAGMTLGISWGTALHCTVKALRPARRFPIMVVQMIGAVGTSDPMIDGPDLARQLANLYEGEYRYLYAPLIVADPHAKEVLLQQDQIRQMLEVARQADVALVGIGSPLPEVSSLLRAGYLTREMLPQLQKRGVVGDVCARHYDIHGQIADIELNQRVVGIELEDLHHIEQVIGVAGGAAKAEAILGALRGHHVNILITDDTAAEKLLALAEEQ